ncbi:MAG: DUF4271 domain-containing protein [Bacteroidales bacterium]|jgi:hypothetical protein|nr:DUF4271 domain-containing protein [Bacteroidales bacterium]MCI1784698.1 DUF4271 domain-containing protein [Bacteroidales bacterium]
MPDVIGTYPLANPDSTGPYMGIKDTVTILPAARAFASGSLTLSEIPSYTVYQGNNTRTSDMTDMTLEFFSVILFLFIFKNFRNIFPNLVVCLGRWKGNLDIEENIKLSRDRNITALFFILPFAVLAGKYELYSPHFMSLVPEGWNTIAITGIFILYIIFRNFLHWQFRPGKSDPAPYNAARQAGANYFILALIAILAATGILSIFRVGGTLAREAILYILAGFYALFLFRKSQILTSSCNPFVTFLYLCALEIFPTGILIATDILL